MDDRFRHDAFDDSLGAARGLAWALLIGVAAWVALLVVLVS